MKWCGVVSCPEDAARTELETAKALLARAHGVLEGIPDLRSLPCEIACFLGWESDQEPGPAPGDASRKEP